MQVRDWPWWRLLVRVTPLLNVHRTEEQLKIANVELHTLKTKIEKLENDRNLLKTENARIESKVSRNEFLYQFRTAKNKSQNSSWLNLNAYWICGYLSRDCSVLFGMHSRTSEQRAETSKSCIFNDPLNVLLYSRVDSWMVRFATSNTPTYNANHCPTLVVKLDHQWSAMNRIVRTMNQYQPHMKLTRYLL
jgi:regulator of replication initiation timing